MKQPGIKRERLLDWIRNGDPALVPVVFGLYNFELAASLLGKKEEEVSWAEAVSVAEQTGTHLLALLGQPMVFDAIPFLDQVKLAERRCRLPDGTLQSTKIITVPEGELVEVRETPPGATSFVRTYLVNGPEDLPKLAGFIRMTTTAIVHDPAVRDKVRDDLLRARDRAGNTFPTMLWVFVPAMELMSSYYMGQETAILLLNDERALMEELMACLWETTKVWLSSGEEIGVDVFGYAVNGFEWLSPDIYRRYMVPQARRINDFASAHDRLSWIHTCGKMKRIAELGMYQEIGATVVESLSFPPTGDIENLARTRALIGAETVTRGGINCELLYGPDQDAVRVRTDLVLDSVKGYRHILGDTNPSSPPYPWVNIRAVIETVRRRGVLYA